MQVRFVSGEVTARALTSEQAQAVQRRRGSLLLAAGAGSGKTAVLVERFAQAVLADAVAPAGVLAITFTERAAWEMKERLRLRLRELGERERARDVETAIVGTFHGFCARLMRADPLAAGVAPGFTVLADGVASRVRQAAFGDALRAVIAERAAQAVDIAAAYGVDRLRAMVIGIHEQLRSRGQRRPFLPAAVIAASGSPAPEPAELAYELIGLLLARFGAAYEARKLQRGAVDFDDLELGALQLLRESESLREQWAQRFELIMVDEFQDTNPRQLELLGAIERDNLFMVGDEWQSIYGFRHAEVGIFRERGAELGRRGATLALTLSFRSVPRVIDAINTVFCERFGERFTPLRAVRAQDGGCSAVEVLLTARDGWEDPLLAARVGDGLPAASTWRQAEARHLARRVEDLLSEGRYGPGDVAVLLRATKDLHVYERALAARGVPTLASTGGFWNGLEVRDVVSYLRALANPLDEIALYSVLASPMVGLSADSLGLIARRAGGGARTAGLWRTMQEMCGRSGAEDALPGGGGALPDGEDPLRSGEDPLPGAEDALPGAEDALPGRDGALLAAFCAHFACERRRLPERSLARLIRDGIAATGYLDHVRGLADGRRAEANLRKLARLASEFERTEGPDLRGFIDHAEHLSDGGAGSEPDAPAAEDRLDAVRLMSIHAAKGLEFPVVCVADLGRTPNRGAAPDLIVEGDRIGLRLLSLDGGEPEPAMEYEQLMLAAREAEAEEEDRILYVAMTRARDLLLLSGACRMSRRSSARASTAPIEWLASALIDDLDGRLDVLHGESAARSQAGAGGPRLLLYGPCTAETALPVAAETLRDRAGRSRLGGDAAESGPDRAHTGMPCPPGADAGRRGAAGEPAAPAAAGLAGAGSADLTASGRSQAPPLSAMGPEVASPARPGGMLSYTSLTQLERCGYRHYLEAVLGLPEQERSGDARAGARPHVRSRATGELAHAVLQRVDFARGRGPEPGEVLARARELGIAIGRGAGRQMAELLGRLIGTDLAARIAAAPHLDTEQPFAFSLGRDQPLIVGTFDLVARERDGTRLIVDYKSGAAHGDLDALVHREFDAQRLIYALAALSDGAERVEVVHWFLRRPEQPVSAHFGTAEAGALSAALRERIHRVRERGFAVSERPHRRLCDGCPGRRRLCSWSEQETRRAPPAS